MIKRSIGIILWTNCAKKPADNHRAFVLWLRNFYSLTDQPFPSMHIVFGLALDQPHAPLSPRPLANTWYLGPQQCLRRLEANCGLAAPPNNIDNLRIEQYRQVLLAYLANADIYPFFHSSFTADQFAVAADLLARRDELLLAGWTFEGSADLPPRLAVLAGLEQVLHSTPGLRLAPGYADRFCRLLEVLPARHHGVASITLNDPPEVLPAYWHRLFDLLRTQGVPVTPSPTPEVSGQSDLHQLQHALNGTLHERSLPARCDGSLCILRAKRDTDLAAFMASVFRLNPGFRPTLLIPDQSRILDNALVQEGLPSLGIPSHSMARPSLQILKLAPVFLWEPLDPYQVMEFVSLSLKPLDADLARRIAQLMAQQPGTQSPEWQNMLGQFIKNLQERPAAEREDVMAQYRFWFERTRYDQAGVAPTVEAVRIYRRIRNWALEQLDQQAENSALAVLAELARQLVEFLESLPEDTLSRLELERIVRTVYESAPVQFIPHQEGAAPVIYQSHALTGEVPDLCWWNFVEYEPDYFFSRWYQPELSWLADQSLQVETPRQANQRLVILRKQAILHTQERLWLMIPEVAEGQEVTPHPLLGDLEALFSNLEELTYAIDAPETAQQLQRFLIPPTRQQLPPQPLPNPQPFLSLSNRTDVAQREYETLTSLETLLYYPYQWFLRHRAQLRKSAILSIVNEQTLLGNLAHRIFEYLLQEADVLTWDRRQVENWIRDHALDLLQREGAVLLLYGKEPTRVQFLRQITFSAWNLIELLQRNGWTVEQTEKPLEGTFSGRPMKGRADLVLCRGQERAILDLKWRGANRRRTHIRNEEDLQLILYAHLLSPDQQWAHTAYYILSTGELIARTNDAFPQLEPVVPDADFVAVNQNILSRMQATYHWRRKQLEAGQIEVRCTQTLPQLEEAYLNDDLLEVLEMRTGDAPFDDYRTLIGLIT